MRYFLVFTVFDCKRGDAPIDHICRVRHFIIEYFYLSKSYLNLPLLSRCALVTNLCLGLFIVLGLPEIQGLSSYFDLVGG